MDKINAVITGVGGYVPEDVLTNEDISKLVDTTDEWIMTRVITAFILSISLKIKRTIYPN